VLQVVVGDLEVGVGEIEAEVVSVAEEAQDEGDQTIGVAEAEAEEEVQEVRFLLRLIYDIIV